jgi:hypothetical protein
VLYFYQALKYVGYFTEEEQGREQELNEVEGLITNFIANGKIKGYISHERRMVVLSNVSPFPLPVR